LISNDHVVKGAAKVRLLTGAGLIDATVVNHAGQAVTELEVSYPSASFGATKLEPGAEYKYHFQVRNSGPMAVDYVNAAGKHVHVEGTALDESMQGTVQIDLLAGDKVEFHPALHSGN
jgi:hypothetical protein